MHNKKNNNNNVSLIMFAYKVRMEYIILLEISIAGLHNTFI